ncbi:MAG: ribbon-helix-helix protein, CopG family [Chloroflexi bacterium]|nr:ribbon-helix-helix protein, CopG family [Chloroflexota bacterium]
MKGKIIQVPMDEELVAKLDARAEKAGRPRAEIIRAACRAHLRRLEEAEQEQAYIEGYRRIPEDPALAEAMASLAAQILPREAW